MKLFHFPLTFILKKKLNFKILIYQSFCIKDVALDIPHTISKCVDICSTTHLN